MCSSVLVYELGFRRVRNLVFQDLSLVSAHFWLNSFEVLAFWRGWNEFKVQFWWIKLGLSEFEDQHVKFKDVRSLLYLGSIQH